jgi:hypothetical protein
VQLKRFRDPSLSRVLPDSRILIRKGQNLLIGRRFEASDWKPKKMTPQRQALIDPTAIHHPTGSAYASATVPSSSFANASIIMEDWT